MAFSSDPHLHAIYENLTLGEPVTIPEYRIPIFRAELLGSTFWQLLPEEDSTGLDGADWILEAYEGGKYHVVSRWEGGAIEEIALVLVGLSGYQVRSSYLR